jgi:5,10-methylenetetrahydrofolate reductase
VASLHATVCAAGLRKAGAVRVAQALTGTVPSLPLRFVSVTCSAGRRRRRTLEMVTRIKGEFGIEAMPHLTCLGASRGRLRPAPLDARRVRYIRLVGATAGT